MPPRPLAARAPAAIPPPVVRVPPRDPAAGLVEAGRLADHGHLVEAAICCEEYVREFGASATALSLLGLVREAAGNPAEAAAFYRKALYLDPDHYDTQVHLALLMDQQGDPEGAQVLRDRTRRLELKRKASHA
jgi:chemotaxis protein methyltransferase WspC